MSDDGIIFAYRHGIPDLDTDELLDPFSIEGIEILRPAHLDRRVIAQQSIFTVEPYNREYAAPKESDIRYWHVSALCAEVILEELGQLGISEGTLFPGLEAVAKEIKRTLLSIRADPDLIGNNQDM